MADTRGHEGHIATFACVGLACMFSGIWLGDRLFVEHLDKSQAVISMRAYSLVVYALVCLVVVCFLRKRRLGLRRIFTVSVCVSLVAYASGMACAFILQPAPSGTLLDWVMFFLTKLIGAPLTIGLVCVFSRLERRLMIRMSALGMFGAFIIYILLGRLINAWALSELFALACSLLLLVAASAMCLLGIQDKICDDDTAGSDTIVAAGVVKMHWRSVFSLSYVLLIIFSATMLGYLRNGYSFGDAHDQLVSVVVLALLTGVCLAWKSLRIEHIFDFALIFSAAGMLLYPFLNLFGEGSGAIVYGLGTALFEVVVWVLAARLARNSFETLLVATLARTAAVFGHFLGSLIVLLSSAYTGNAEEGIVVSGLILMFLCVLMFLHILRNPRAQSMFMAVEDGAGDASGESLPGATSVGAQFPYGRDADGDGARGAAGDTASVPAVSPEDYWRMPCEIISDAYKLTRRERDVLQELAHGYTMAVMEDHLVISHNTMKMHLRHIYTKLDVHSRQDVIDMVEQVRNQ